MNYILKNATIITMKDHEILHDTDIFVAQGKIWNIGNNLSVSGIHEIDCSGKYIMPGLMDSHIHMDSNEITEMLLANGVTTCRNMWGTPLTQKWVSEINHGKRFGPNVITTGPLTDGIEYWKDSSVVTTPEEGEKAVIDTIEGGYDLFKTYPWIPRDTFLKIMETANKLGIKVVGHGNYNVTAKELADSGYYSLEHAGNLPEKSEDIILLAESGMWFCPTFIVCHTLEKYVHQGIPLTETKNYDCMCEFWHKDWQRITDWRQSLHRYDDLDYPAQVEAAKLFVKHSDHILLGTDTPNPGVTGGFSIFEEMEYFRDYLGMSPYSILRTCTTNPARCMGISKSKGMVQVGMDADMLILGENPLADIRNTQKINAVICGGTIHWKDELDIYLEKAKKYTQEEIEPWCL